MKLLSKEELKGIESTSATIEKWHELFKTALPNLGYKDNLIENIYPYSKGVPMKDGTFMPVSEKTGRIFFKLSWADKLAGELSVFSGNAWLKILKVMHTLWTDSLEICRKFSPDCTEEDFDALRSLSDSEITFSYLRSERKGRGVEVLANLWKKFILASDVHSLSIINRDNIGSQGNISEEDREHIANATQIIRDIPVPIFIYCRLIENEYSKFPKDLFRDAASRMQDADALTRLKLFEEVYLQDYLVISLNPIDKFMCSTKQAFSSCISIAKQDDIRGTSSNPAFGLPATFPSESIFMVYMTPGKHKNMYFDSDEWIKAPEDRDKEKAYKYIKMTCRSWTYMGTMTNEVRSMVKNLKSQFYYAKEIHRELEILTDALKVDQPRLMIGRQYASSRHEDYVWPPLMELLLAKQGISTSMAFAEEVAELRAFIRKIKNESFQVDTQGTWKAWNQNILRCGALCDHKGVVIDRYGERRGIYYDNISWCFDTKKEQKTPTGKKYYSEDIDYPTKEGAQHLILVGSSRGGSLGVQLFTTTSAVDMFKVIQGQQDYTFVNSCTTKCSNCGKILKIKDTVGSYGGKSYCPDCLSKKNLERCPFCDIIYDKNNKKEVEEHSTINLREITNPNNYEEFEQKLVCKYRLKTCSVGDDSRGINSSAFVCAHCGEINTGYLSTNNYIIKKEFHGMNIKVAICNDCLRKAVMCDRCKRVIFLEDLSDAAILLPNRRVVCSDCIDGIRLKRERREILKTVIKDLKNEDLVNAEAPEEKLTLLDKVARKIESRYGSFGRTDILIKSIFKQMKTYIQYHPEEGLPKLQEPHPERPLDLVTEETAEIDDLLAQLPY